LTFKEDSIVARAKQILDVKDDRKPSIRKNFISRINQYHPDRHGSLHTEQAKVIIEAYEVLSGRVKPLDCKLLENDDLVASLLPKGVKLVKLEDRYEDWLKENFYDFVKPE
jgi:hypothetical protein